MGYDKVGKNSNHFSIQQVLLFVGLRRNIEIKDKKTNKLVSTTLLFLFLLFWLYFAALQLKNILFFVAFGLFYLAQIVFLVYLLYQVVKSFLYIRSVISTYSKKLALILFFQLINDWFKFIDLFCQFLMVQKITFVPHQNLWNLISTVKHQLLQPHFCIVERLFIGNVKDDTCGFREVKVVINDGSESLLSCRVPQLKGEGGILMGYVFEFVIHSNCCFLRYVFTVNVTKQKSTFTDGRFADNDSFKRFNIEAIQMAHGFFELYLQTQLSKKPNLLMVIGKIIKTLVWRDEMIWRKISRLFAYRYFRFEHYRLQSIRAKMWEYREISKQQMLKKQSDSKTQQNSSHQKQYEWKWVYVVKQATPKTYSSQWRQKLEAKIDKRKHNIQEK